MRAKAAITSVGIVSARVGQDHRAMTRWKRADPELFLQQLYLMTDRGGRNGEFLRRNREGAEPGSGLKRLNCLDQKSALHCRDR